MQSINMGIWSLSIIYFNIVTSARETLLTDRFECTTYFHFEDKRHFIECRKGITQYFQNPTKVK